MPAAVLQKPDRAGDAEANIISNPLSTCFVLVIEYNGSRYAGYQLQANKPSIQGELEVALFKLTGEKIRVYTASRTDAGVHARGQVVSFKTESLLQAQVFIDGLNYYLPRDIAVQEAHQTGDFFNPRRRATSREYSYYILNSHMRSPLWEGRTFHVKGVLDMDAMNRACRLLIGEHDLASFASNLGVPLTSTVRRILRAGVEKEGGLTIFKIEANAFLPHQVRNTIGALIRVGLGRMTVDEFHSIIDARKIGLAGPTAPACGLYLEKVNYRQDFKESEK